MYRYPMEGEELSMPRQKVHGKAKRLGFMHANDMTPSPPQISMTFIVGVVSHHRYNQRSRWLAIQSKFSTRWLLMVLVAVSLMRHPAMITMATASTTTSMQFGASSEQSARRGSPWVRSKTRTAPTTTEAAFTYRPPCRTKQKHFHYPQHPRQEQWPLTNPSCRTWLCRQSNPPSKRLFAVATEQLLSSQQQQQTWHVSQKSQQQRSAQTKQSYLRTFQHRLGGGLPFRSMRLHSTRASPLLARFRDNDDNDDREDGNDRIRTSRDNNNNNNSQNGDDEYEWQVALSAFQTYQQLYQDLLIPMRFVVPHIDPWPRSARGMKLGRIVAQIRATGKFVAFSPERQATLEQLGFKWRVREPSSLPVSNNNNNNQSTNISTTGRNEPQQQQQHEDQTVPWEQVLEAYQAFGENVISPVVPPQFVVPDIDPWPESVRGFPLGRQLEQIVQSVLPYNPTARDQFAKAGYPVPPLIMTSPPRDSSSNSNSNVDASNRANVGSVTVAPFQSSNTNDNDNRMNINDVRFQRIYTALQTYKKIYGDLRVPQPFEVPENTDLWPEETWGIKLGSRVNAIRSLGTFINNNPNRRILLDQLGFEWELSRDDRRKKRGGRRSVTISDTTINKGNNNEDTDQDDELNKDDNDDDGTVVEDRTGQIVNSLPLVPPTHDNLFDKEQVDELEANESSNNDDEESDDLDLLFGDPFDFGKDFESLSRQTKPTSESVPPAWDFENAAQFPGDHRRSAEQAERSREEDNYYTPPQDFEESLRLATVRAKEVGIIEGITDQGRIIKGKRTKQIPWFNDDFGDDFVFEDVVEALTIYKSIYGDFTNFTDGGQFVIPSPTTTEMTGFLDDSVDASTRAAAAIARYEQMGDFDRQEDLINSEIRRLQQEVRYQAEIATETELELKAIRAFGEWPEHLAGMSLGNIVTRIRDGSLEVKHLPERKKQLDDIGFDWGDPKYFIDVPFEKAMCAMYAYYLIRGDTFVLDDFTMPDEEPWPEALAGYEIGQAVKRLRELQNFLEAYHPEKVSLLRMLDFVWFPDTMALPLDPNEAEMTPEKLLLCAMGHPDYSTMIDIPMGLPDKIIADGPFYDSDDPKLWWRKWHNWDYVKDYWYQQGRRDNAFVLRGMGYYQMADEHEAKYGLGIISQINNTLNDLDENGIDLRTNEERQELFETLNFYRQEMLGCTDIHPNALEQLLADMDTHLLTIVKGFNKDMNPDDSLRNLSAKREIAKDEGKGDPPDEDDDWVDTQDIEDDYFDVNNELGLGQQ